MLRALKNHSRSNGDMMHFSRRLPARAALAAVTAGALALTITGCGSSHSSSSKSNKSGSHSSGSSGSGVSKSKGKGKKKKRKKRGVGTGGTAAKRQCRGSDLDVTVNKRSRAGGYLELVIEGANRSCYLPRTHADVEFGTKKKVHASSTRSGDVNERIRITPADGVAYVGLRANSTGKEGTTYPGFDIGTGGGRPGKYVKVPGGVKVDRPLVTGFHREAEDAVPGTETVG